MKDDDHLSRTEQNTEYEDHDAAGQNAEVENRPKDFTDNSNRAAALETWRTAQTRYVFHRIVIDKLRMKVVWIPTIMNLAASSESGLWWQDGNWIR